MNTKISSFTNLNTWKEVKRFSKKAILSILAILVIGIPLLYLTVLNSRSAEAAWWNSEWTYRKKITIANSSGSSLSDHQASFTIDTTDSSKFQSDCDDIRITDSQGTLLSHWIDDNSAGCNNAATKIWTKIPSLATTDTTIYIYYGNPSAANTQDGEAVFEFFDDFSAGSLDETKWTANVVGNITATTGGYFRATDATKSSTTYWIYGNSATQTGNQHQATWTPTSNFIVEWKGSLNDTGGALGSSQMTQIGIGAVTTDNTNIYTAEIDDPCGGNDDAIVETTQIERAGAGTNQAITGTVCTADGTNGVYSRNFTLIKNGNNYETQIDGSSVDTYTDATSISKLAIMVGAYGGYPFVTYAQLEDVRIRKYASTEPSATLGSEETNEGPAAYWKFDEGYGQTPQDLVSGNHDGILGANTGSSTDDPTWIEEGRCVSGKCLSFDGGDYVGIGSTASPAIKTVSFWVKPKTNSESIIDFNGGSQKITASGGTISATGFSSPTYYINGVATATPTLTANTWQQITVTTGTAFGATNITIGKVGAAFLTGFLDDIKIYNTTKTAAQVKGLYDSRGSPKEVSAQMGGADLSYLSNGLVGYWKMDDAGIDAEGETITDSSANSNTGTLYGDNSTGDNGAGMDCTAAGRYGTGCSVDGTDDYVSVSDSTSLDSATGAGQARTLSFWFKTNYGNGNYVVMEKNNNEHFVAQTFNSGIISWRVGSTSTNRVNSLSSISDNSWHHFTGIYDGTNNILYIDGVLQGSHSDTAPADNDNAFVMGSRSGTTAWPGSLDEVRIYNRALSPKEVSDLYNWAPGPVGEWNFEERSGPTVNNTSGTGGNGTWSGTGSHWTQGKYGAGGNFNNSTSDYVGITDSAALKPSSISVSAWVKTTDTGTYRGIIDRYTGSESGYFIDIYAGGVAGVPRFWVNTGFADFNGQGARGSTAVNDGNWHFLEGTYDSTTSTANLYVDGVLVGSNNEPGSVGSGAIYYQSAHDIKIGGDNVSTYYLTGQIDQVKIYNYARTAKQVMADMNIGRPAVGTPVGYWKFDEGQGVTARNAGSGGSIIDGTITSGTWSDAGKYGKAISFNGSTSVINAGNVTANQLTDTVSVSAWINGTAFADGDHKSVAGKSTAFTTNGYGISIYDNAPRFYAGVSSAVSPTSLNTSQWYHVVGTYDKTLSSNNIKVYVNGVLKGQTTQAAGITDAATNFKIGSVYAGVNFFNGLIDEVKLYNYALTADEVKVEYNQGKSLVLGSGGDNSTYQPNSANQEYCIPGDSTSCAAPVGEWKMEEANGDKNDTSGNNYTLTNNLVTATVGKYGKAARFVSTNPAYLYIADNADLSTGDIDWTINMWVRFRSATASQEFAQKYTAGVSADKEWYLKTTSGSVASLTWYTNGSGGNQSVSANNFGALSANTWYFISAYHDATNDLIGISVNGGPFDTASAAGGNDGAGIFALGGLDGSSYCDCDIDQVRVYRYLRTPAQVAYDYNKGKPAAQWKFDECQGTTINDSSGNNYNGTWSAGETYTQAGTCSDGNSASAWYGGRTGKFNSSLDFDGTASNKVTIGTAINNIQSVAFWVKPTTSSDSFMDLDGGTHYITSSSGTISAAGFTTPTIYVNGVTNGAVTGGAWNHVVVTTGTAFNTTTNFTLGYKSAAPADYLTGQLDDVRIYNYALTQTQIKQAMNDGSAIRFGPTTGSP